jgi:hypothetical protein
MVLVSCDRLHCALFLLQSECQRGELTLVVIVEAGKKGLLLIESLQQGQDTRELAFLSLTIITLKI